MDSKIFIKVSKKKCFERFSDERSHTLRHVRTLDESFKIQTQKKALNLSHDMPYFSISSLHCLCVAKQAMAHILISTPVWNCFPRMSHTPWLGVATVLFCQRERKRKNMVDKNKSHLFQWAKNKHVKVTELICFWYWT